MRWPPNLDVIDGLIHCFDKPCNASYGDAACRAGLLPAATEAAKKD